MPNALAVPSVTAVRRAHFTFKGGTLAFDPELEQLLGEATEYALASRSKGTRDNYESAWNAQIAPFCAKFKCLPYPMKPNMVSALYVWVVRSGREPGNERTILYLKTVRNVLSLVHRYQKLVDPTESPLARSTYQGLMREYGLRPKHPKLAIYPEEVGRMMRYAALHPLLAKGIMHCAVLACGSAGAMRCSEVRALNVADVTFDRFGATIAIGKSKTDQNQIGREIFIARTKNPKTDPVGALERYRALVRDDDGPFFRTVVSPGRLRTTRACTKTLRRIIKFYGPKIGLPLLDIGFHSLRAGFITAGVENGVPMHELMDQTGHLTIDSMMHYYRPRFRRSMNLSAVIGL